LEALYKFIDYDLFWNKFVQPYGPNQGVTNCGWTHYPPNGRSDYDWRNTETVESRCENWDPEGNVEITLVNCYTWGDHTCPDDGGASFKIWWMQNIPGRNNDLYYQDNKLRDWWEFVDDFDSALDSGKNFLLPDTTTTTSSTTSTTTSTTTTSTTTSTTLTSTTFTTTTLSTSSTTILLDNNAPQFFNFRHNPLVVIINQIVEVLVECWDDKEIQKIIISENSSGIWINHTVYG
jgi:hypothetical protein